MNTDSHRTRILNRKWLMILTLTSLLGIAVFTLWPHKPEFSFRIYGHRGARALAPENTLQAYKLALDLGVDAVDMDINMSRDGVLVVTHDTTLNPDLTRDHRGHWIASPIPIKSLSLNQLRHYNVGKIKPNCHYAKLFQHQHPYQFALMPTLKETIQFVKRYQHKPTRFQIEIKSSPIEPHLSFSPTILAKALNAVLVDEGIADIAEVQSFDFRCLIALHKINPQIRTAYLTGSDQLSMPKRELKQWLAGYDLRAFHHSFPELIAHIGGSLWEPEDTMLTKAELDHAHALGLEVVVWSDPVKTHHNFTHTQLTQLNRWGVNGVILDDPRI